MFIAGGIDALRDPSGKVAAAENVTEPLSDAIEQLPDDTEMLIRANGALQVGAGLAMVSNKMARPAALALAASLVPTTAAGHRFWEMDQGAPRQQQIIHFLKNLGLLGGLIITVLDTQGEPGVAWRAAHAVDHAGLMKDHASQVAGLQTELAKERAKASTAATKARFGATARQAKRDAKVAAKVTKSAGRAVTGAGRAVKRVVTAALPG